jgi:hypothetical protein
LSKALWVSGKGRFLGSQRDGIGGTSVLEVAREKELAVYAHPARDSKSNSYQSVPGAEIPSPRPDTVRILYKKELVHQSFQNQ